MSFGPAAYRRLLGALSASGRPAVGFAPRPSRGCLLRLDVDYDLDLAVCTAEINAEAKIAATYFVLMGSDLYNPASAGGRHALARLSALGQRVALHYHHAGDGPLDLARLETEFRHLSDLVPQAERVVSWHNPEGELGPLNRAAEAAGFTSAYGEAVFGPDRYISDSNQRHQPEAITAWIEASRAPVIQVLLHPFNWITGGPMPEVLRGTFSRKVDELIEAFGQNSVWRAQMGEEIAAQVRTAPWYRRAGPG